MKGEMRCQVARSRAEVFDFVADLRNESQWNPRAIGMEKLTEGPIGSGTRFAGTYQGLGSLETVLTEYQPPGRLGFHSTGPRAEIRGLFVLKDSGGGTDIALEADVRPRGVLRYLAPAMQPLFARQNKAAAGRLQAALQQRAQE